jgi:hypothetical protein
MSSKLVLEGLDGFRAALRQLPQELAQEAGDIVSGAATTAGEQIQRAYGEKTGRLRRGVKVTQEQAQFGARAIVRSTAPHASIYEYGTKQRRNSKGANRGTMPAFHAAIPIIVGARKSMVSKLVQLVRRAGFQVEGV